MTKSWNITIDGKQHLVELDHKTWTNNQELKIDKTTVYKTPGIMQIGGVIGFIIDGHECAVIISNKLLGFNYDLVIDGVSLETGKKRTYQAVKPVTEINTKINNSGVPSSNEK